MSQLEMSHGWEGGLAPAEFGTEFSKLSGGKPAFLTMKFHS
jgi:hypothetical protein